MFIEWHLRDNDNMIRNPLIIIIIRRRRPYFLNGGGDIGWHWGWVTLRYLHDLRRLSRVHHPGSTLSCEWRMWTAHALQSVVDRGETPCDPSGHWLWWLAYWSYLRCFGWKRFWKTTCQVWNKNDEIHHSVVSNILLISVPDFFPVALFGAEWSNLLPTCFSRIPYVIHISWNHQLDQLLGGGFKLYFWNVHPDPWGNDPIWLAHIFSHLLKPPTQSTDPSPKALRCSDRDCDLPKRCRWNAGTVAWKFHSEGVTWHGAGVDMLNWKNPGGRGEQSIKLDKLAWKQALYQAKKWSKLLKYRVL